MGTGNVYSTYDPTALFAGAWPVRHRPMTFAAGANPAGTVLARGTVVGRITASDKYIPCVKTAADGSQVPAGVVAADIDASAADTVGPGYDEGEFAAEKLILDASWTIQTLQAALRQAGSRLYARTVGTIG